jgi:hypothetical protein
MSMVQGSPLPIGVLDPATTAWVAAVIANGGTVSSTQQGFVDTLIKGLKTDGIFSKLDRLWLYASENTFQALTDIVADSLATAVNSPAFTANRGYAGNGSNAEIDSNFNPTTAPSPKFVQDSANLFAWNNTSGTSATPWLCGQGSAGQSQITPFFTDNSDYYSLNGSSALNSAGTGATGLYLLNRTSSSTITLDVNGAQQVSAGEGSVAITSSDIFSLENGSGNFGNRQCSCLGFGSGLSGTDRTNIYSRLRTYMTSVGVP